MLAAFRSGCGAAPLVTIVRLDEYRLKVAAAGGIKAVVAAIVNQTAHDASCVADRVQLVGCSALRNLAAPGRCE